MLVVLYFVQPSIAEDELVVVALSEYRYCVIFSTSVSLSAFISFVPQSDQSDQTVSERHTILELFSLERALPVKSFPFIPKVQTFATVAVPLYFNTISFSVLPFAATSNSVLDDFTIFP